MAGLVISLSAKGLTTGEVQAHLAEVYGAEVSRQTISTITDKVLDGMAEWQNRPLDAVYPVIFIDAINVKIRALAQSIGRTLIRTRDLFIDNKIIRVKGKGLLRDTGQLPRPPADEPPHGGALQVAVGEVAMHK
ncbi:hypothetical protein GCM10009609_74530 [Pseudonocardia aurantiaca]